VSSSVTTAKPPATTTVGELLKPDRTSRSLPLSASNQPAKSTSGPRLYNSTHSPTLSSPTGLYITSLITTLGRVVEDEDAGTVVAADKEVELLDEVDEVEEEVVLDVVDASNNVEVEVDSTSVVADNEVEVLEDVEDEVDSTREMVVEELVDDELLEVEEVEVDEVEVVEDVVVDVVDAVLTK